jgi:quinol-cytochrome oxidoreductase complex cytochrome b subunit
MTTYPRSEKDMAISFLTIRWAIGVLGMALPFVLGIGGFVLFGHGIQSSISYYARTEMGPVLVGTLFAAGFFLLGYRGYERADDVAGFLAWLFALGVALFTCGPDSGGTPQEDLIGTFHLIFSILLFATLVFFALFLFTKTRPDQPPSPEKKRRNAVYKVCGGVMAACMLLALAYIVLPPDAKAIFTPLHPVYWMEGASLEAFGISWFVKGEGILKDGESAVG